MLATVLPAHDDPARLELFGELDAYSGPEARDRIRAYAMATGQRWLVLDMAQVTFIDSTAVGCLVAMQQWLRQGDGDLRLANATGPVLRVLEIMGLLVQFGLAAKPLGQDGEVPEALLEALESKCP
jgi:anti-sigma B factor antagonist